MKTTIAIILAMIIAYAAYLAWFIWDGYRIEASVEKVVETVGFDHYIVWTCKHDRTPKEAVQAAEKWALEVDPESIDAVNVRQWVEYIKSKKGAKNG